MTGSVEGRTEVGLVGQEGVRIGGILLRLHGEKRRGEKGEGRETNVKEGLSTINKCDVIIDARLLRMRSLILPAFCCGVLALSRLECIWYLQNPANFCRPDSLLTC